MNIVIVDDCLQDQEKLKESIQRYCESNKENVDVTCFSSGKEFLDSNREFDVIFLDIEMPGIDGMQAARIIREHNKAVPIIFVTNMANYALKGYEVHAMDFIVKPIEYESFQDRFSRAINFAKSQQSKIVMVNDDNDDISCIYTKDICYIEKKKNYTFYHTSYGTYHKRETLEQAIESISGYTLLQASSGLYINPNFLEKILSTSIVVNGEEMPLARRRKQLFIEKYMQYLSQRNKS
jgi:two-component system, LytTR family, response regulator LytT